MAEYHVENLGCRANQADGEAIASQLRHAGWRETAPEFADVIVLNTCSVTAEAERDARAAIRRFNRQNPGCRVVVTGCYAQRAPQELVSLTGVDQVVGNSHKSVVPILALGLAGQGTRCSDLPSPFSLVDEYFAHSELATLPFASDGSHTRPNLKVQDGCGNRCSFCIIPTTRGPSRSVPLEECLLAVNRFAEGGGQELVLSGINLGRWGRDLSPKRRFEDLVGAIVEQTRLPRLRISSVEPMDWSPELISLMTQYAPRLARHAHLPLQSGSDGVLRAMHRRYRPWHYAERIHAIRAALPDAAIGADIMVGFPGETEAQFQESFDFISGLPLTYAHLFSFSARPGTRAWMAHREHPVSSSAVKERMASLSALFQQRNQQFRQRFVGSEISAVTLKDRSQDHTSAVSDNFIKLNIDQQIGPNRLVRVQIRALTAFGLSGTLVTGT